MLEKNTVMWYYYHINIIDRVDKNIRKKIKQENIINYLKIMMNKIDINIREHIRHEMDGQIQKIDTKQIRFFMISKSRYKGKHKKMS